MEEKMCMVIKVYWEAKSMSCGWKSQKWGWEGGNLWIERVSRVNPWLNQVIHTWAAQWHVKQKGFVERAEMFCTLRLSIIRNFGSDMGAQWGRMGWTKLWRDLWHGKGENMEDSKLFHSTIFRQTGGQGCMATCTQWFELMPKQAKQQQHGIRKVEITDLMEETSPQNEEMRWREAKQYHLTKITTNKTGI